MEYIRAAKCFHGNMLYRPGDSLNLSSRKKTAEKFLANRNSSVFKKLLLNQQQKLKELVKRVGTGLDRELKKLGVNSLPLFRPLSR